METLPLPRPPLPEPRRDELAVLPAGTLAWRVYRAGGRHPVTWSTFRAFGPVATARFDHQEPPPHEDMERAVLYAALTPEAAIVESFQDTRLVDRVRDAPWLAAFALAEELTALDLRRTWPTRAGASQAISSGPRVRAQAWSRAIHATMPAVQGLVYPSAMAGTHANVALYERSRSAMPRHPSLNVPLAHPGLETAIGRIAARYGYGLR